MKHVKIIEEVSDKGGERILLKRKRRKKIKLEPRFYVIMTTLTLGIITMTGKAIQTPAKTDSTVEFKLEEKKHDKNNEVLISEEILEINPYATQAYVVNLMNNTRIYNNFYEDIVGAYNPTELTALVNKNYQLPEDFKPTDLVVLDVAYANEVLGESQTMLRKEAASQAVKMFNQAKKEGLVLLAKSGFRSYNTQAQLYNDYVAKDGKEQADTYSARPGHSEHQLGLALDITSDSVYRELTVEFGKTKEGRWLQENAHKFGFIVRYPEGKEHLTGFQYEPWHVRYVGVSVAEEIYEKSLLLEDYILMQEK